MPDGPLWASAYITGAYIFGAIIVVGIARRPHALDELGRRAGLSPAAVRASALIVWTLLWPIALCALLAMALASRRSGGE